MIPIYENSGGEGIGYGIDSFFRRFDAIWEQHVAENRAQSFAFIFYDFNDTAIRRILADQGVFAKLDRLSGNKLSIFYLHKGSQASTSSFNYQFLTALEVHEEVELPCIVFFKFQEKRIENVSVVPLDHADLVHGFQELFAAVEAYLESETPVKTEQPRALRWFKAGSKFISKEIFREALRRGLEGWP